MVWELPIGRCKESNENIVVGGMVAPQNMSKSQLLVPEKVALFGQRVFAGMIL